MSRLVVTAFVGILTLSLMGCDNAASTNTNENANSHPDDPKTHIAQTEQDFQESIMDTAGENRTGARIAATEYIKKKLPDWTIKGIASDKYYSWEYWVDVNIAKDDQEQIISLSVKKFFPESGEAYWKARPLTKDVESQMRDMDSYMKAGK